MAQGKLLEGIRVLDFTQYIASALATRILSDMGAEVIHVERYPHGDLSRVSGLLTLEDGVSAMFLSNNVGKKSLCVDLKSPEGVDLIKRLIPHFDLLAEGYTPGQMAKYGLDYETVRAIKPDIIYLSMSGFGQTGPMRDWLSLDPIIQALGGIMDVTGQPDGPPSYVATGVADPNGAVHAALAAVAALFYRFRTGVGQYVDTSMLESLVHVDCMMMPLVVATEGAANPTRFGRHHTLIAPCGIYRCGEGWVMLDVLGSGPGSMWDRFCQVLGRLDLRDDPRFVDNPARLKHHEELQPIIQAWFDQHPDPWEASRYLQEHRITCGPVLSPRETFQLDHLQERGLFPKVYHPEAGREIRVIGNPLHFSETPTGPTIGAPFLGQHNAEVLSTYLGMSEAEIGRLHERRVLYQDPHKGQSGGQQA